MAKSESWLYAAWLVALLATLGALFIGEVIGQEPCRLCWFQRIFMFPLSIILGVAAFRADSSVWLYAIPLAFLGGLVAGYHSLVYSGAIKEALRPCSASGPDCAGSDMLAFGAIPLPYLSFLSFLLITIALGIAHRMRLKT